MSLAERLWALLREREQIARLAAAPAARSQAWLRRRADEPIANDKAGPR